MYLAEGIFRDGILKLIDSYPGNDILFTGGEPLLTTKLDKYPYLGDYLKHASLTNNTSKFKKIRVITNGFSIPGDEKNAKKFFEKLVSFTKGHQFWLEISYDPEKVRQYNEKLKDGEEILKKKIRWAHEFSEQYNEEHGTIGGKKYRPFNVKVQYFVLQAEKIDDSWVQGDIGVGCAVKSKKFIAQGGAQDSTYTTPSHFRYGTTRHDIVSIDLSKLMKDIAKGHNLGIIVRPDGILSPYQVLSYMSTPDFLCLGNIFTDSVNDIAKRMYSILPISRQEEIHRRFPEHFPMTSKIDIDIVRNLLLDYESYQEFFLTAGSHVETYGDYFCPFLDHVGKRRREKYIEDILDTFIEGLSHITKAEWSRYDCSLFYMKNGKLLERVAIKRLEKSPLLVALYRLDNYLNLLSKVEYRDLFTSKLADKLNVGQIADETDFKAEILLAILRKGKLIKKMANFDIHTLIGEMSGQELERHVMGEDNVAKLTVSYISYLKALNKIAVLEKNSQIEKQVKYRLDKENITT